MGTSYDDIVAAALLLPPGARATLVEQLLDSLDDSQRNQTDAPLTSNAPTIAVQIEEGTVAAKSERPEGIDRSFAHRITELIDQWRRKTGHLSSIDRKATHPAYQAIIATGNRGVPYVLRELKSNGGHWFWALHYMTGLDLGEPGQTVDDLRNAWLTWGKSQGYSGL